jgi:hypothetical protein
VALPTLKKIPDWIYCGPGSNEIHCKRCGAKKQIALPQPIDAFILEMHAFGITHEGCKEK